ncbi:MAG: peptidylprolyl isomerase [Geminicoccaceae bacterium]
MIGAMSRPMLALFWLIGGVSLISAPVIAQGIVAVVNDEIVSEWELDQRVKVALVLSNLDPTQENESRVRPQVLRGAIDDELRLQEANRLNVSITDDALDQVIESIAERNRMNVDEFFEIFTSRGVEENALREQYRAQVAWESGVSRLFSQRVNVSEAQVDRELKRERETRNEPDFHLLELFLPVYRDQSEAEVLADADRLLDALESGASFSALASQVSAAPSAENGGDLGWLKLRDLPEALRSVVGAMEPGEVSGPVQTPRGVYLFALADKRQAGGFRQEIVRVSLAQLFLPANAAPLPQLLDRAGELRRTVGTCDDMDRVGEQLALPASGRLGWVAPGDLPPVLSATVVSLRPGATSAPVQGPAGVHVLMVCDRETRNIPLPPPPPVTREEIQQRLEREALEQLAERHLRILRKDAFIEVRI